MDKNIDNLKIRFILSSKAGRGIDKDIENKIKKSFKNYPMPDICYTSSEDHIQQLAKQWSDKWQDKAIIYVGGGDGSLNEAAKTLINTKSAMGVLPLGTGNDFSKSVYNTPYPEKILDKIIEQTPFPLIKKIDMLRVNSNFCLNLVSLGYDTVILQGAYDLMDKFPSLGKNSYVLSVIKSIFSKKNYNIKFEATLEDNSKIVKDMVSAITVMGNGGYYGSGYNPLPDAILDDGLGDFLYSDTINFLDVMTLITKYRKGTHLNHKKMHHQRFKDISLSSGDGSNIPINYDGIIFRSDKLHVKILPKSLNFVFLDI